MQDDSELDNSKSTFHKYIKINLMAIMHVRNEMSYLKLLLGPKLFNYHNLNVGNKPIFEYIIVLNSIKTS